MNPAPKKIKPSLENRQEEEKTELESLAMKTNLEIEEAAEGVTEEQKFLSAEKSITPEKNKGFFGNIKRIYEKAIDLTLEAKKEIRNIAKPDKETPLKPGEVFDPESEIKNILLLPSSERPNALELFKQKTNYQKLGIAELEIELIKIAKKTPDETSSDFNQIIREYEFKYGFNQKQKEQIAKTIKTYEQRRQIVNNLKSKYPTDEKIYKAILGKSPEGKIQIIEGPASLSVRCSDLKDFSRFIFQKEYNELGENEKQALKNIGGIRLLPFSADQKYFNPEFNKSLIILGPRSTPKTLIHEEQHIFNGLFREAQGSPLEPINMLEKNFNFGNVFENIKKIQEEEREKAVKMLFDATGYFLQELIKDEIISLAKEGSKKDSIIRLFTSELSPYYQMSNKIKDFIDKQIGDYRKEKIPNSSSLPELLGLKIPGKKPLTSAQKNDLRLIEQISLEIYSNKSIDAEKNGELAQKAAEALFAVKNSYSLDEAIALLGSEPLKEWPKTASRIMETKK